MKPQKTLICLLCLLLAFSAPACGTAEAPAEEASAPVAAGAAVEDAGIELGGSRVRYPQVKGLADEALQAEVNTAIAAALEVERWVSRVPLLMSSPVKLETGYTAFLQGDVFSAALLAQGDLGTGRSDCEYHTVNLDLTSGAEIALDGLFNDPEAARALLEAQAEEAQAEASPMLAAAAYLPLPERWTLSESGITFYYERDQLTTLRDGCGTLLVPWSALADVLDLTEGNIPERIGAAQTLYLSPESAARIRASAEAGRLPGIPAALGDNVEALVSAWGEAQDPDLYEAGRLVQLEGDAFRGCCLLTDALSEDWAGCRVDGIRSDRLSLWGLVPGVTTRDEWRAYLGEPERTVAIDEDRAASWRIVPGESDYYAAGGHTLRLHADADGVLRHIFLME